MEIYVIFQVETQLSRVKFHNNLHILLYICITSQIFNTFMRTENRCDESIFKVESFGTFEINIKH